MRYFFSLVIGMLLFSLVACDSASNTQTVSLLDGQLNFKLLPDMTDKTDQLSQPAKDKYLYADPTGSKTIIVIISELSQLPLSEQAQRLIAQRQARTPDLKIIDNSALQLSNQAAQKITFESVEGGEQLLSTLLLSQTKQHSVTLQISVPATDLPMAQKITKEIINTMQLP